ncbi:MAG: carbohydrate binding family 9 domain-containing protein [Rhodothermales bacterium]|nr:carbohydrate binding family 9 domain-containing protein [Rhodothermales bacterium]MBO6779437.1 carbohydrate binding family 9 domain-containing protein [Rhodothermales bacterium]
MLRSRVLPALSLLLMASPARAQMAQGVLDDEPPRISAVRAAQGAPRVDGRLDDAVWASAPVATGFRQDFPVDGDPASERTEVRVAYDDQALYVGARLLDSDPDGIAGRLARRDNEEASDRFIVSIDSYHDHRTAFRFSVNPSGVRADYIATNDSDNEDFSWDPVWEAATSIDQQGWVVEMRIPFSQLRFSGADEQTWGINFTRRIFRKSEWAAWSWWENEEQGFASHFGHLDGLRGIQSPRRLEVLPYTVAKTDHDQTANPNNPFNDGSLQSVTAGLDVNLGVTSDLTLNATVNPDFGQVEADPAEVNLTVFETFFEERRPFFVEGANLFQFGAGSGGFIFGAPQLFYSRRVGRAPSRPVFEPGGFVDNPINTSILAATKLSGQTGGWSIGLLEAVTGREVAPIQRADGTRTEAVVEPRSNYAVASLRRDFREGSSSIGILGTAVNRDIADPALSFLPSSAYSGGIDFFHRFGDNRFVVNGTFSGSAVRGEPDAITRLQRSSARYFQRPDQDYVSVDTAATSLTGYATSFQIDKVSGDWLVGADFYAYSPGFEINDAGFLTGVDEIFTGFRVTRRWLEPGKVFRTFRINATGFRSQNYGGTRTGRGAFLGLNGQFLNYWGSNASFNLRSDNLNPAGTRGGPNTLLPANWSLNVVGFSDGRKRLSGHLWTTYARNRFDGWGLFSGGGLTWRAASNINVSLFPNFRRVRTIGQYVTARPDPFATGTFGARYLYAELHQHQVSATIRMDVALSPDMSVQWYAQPFISTGDYQEFKELTAPGSYDFLIYGASAGSTIESRDDGRRLVADPDGPGPVAPWHFANPDFRVRSLRSNLVFRWEYIPGSTLFLVWNHGRSGFSPNPEFSFFDQLSGILDEDMQNTFIVKLNYWLSR